MRVPRSDLLLSPTHVIFFSFSFFVFHAGSGTHLTHLSAILFFFFCFFWVNYTTISSDPPSSPFFQNQETNFSIQTIPTKFSIQTISKTNTTPTTQKTNRVGCLCVGIAVFLLHFHRQHHHLSLRPTKKNQETNFSNRTIPTKNLYKFHR